MVNEELKNYAVAALTAALLISLGVNVGINDTHVCLDLGISMHCDRLSSTEKTCYPAPQTTVGKKFCSDGWLSISTLKDTVFVPSNASALLGAAWLCSPYECVRIR